MIFHICSPEILFIRSLLDRFEQVKPGFNRCIIIVSRHHKNSMHNIDKNLIEYIGPLNKSIIQRINESKCQGVVIHSLNDDILELSLELAGRVPVIWRSWGPDLHDILYPDFNPLLPYTKRLVAGRNKIYEFAIDLLRPVHNLITGRKKESENRVLKKLEFLKKVKFIATATLTEFILLQKRVPNMKANHIKLNYRSLDINRLPGLINNANSKNIMVGHSSFSYHNHADVFYQLSNDSYNESLIAPLNYGNVFYRDKIIAFAKKLLKTQVNFLIDLLKFDDYLGIINSCSAFILNSKVQSGGGNIIYFLYQGSKVYLREENPIFRDFTDLGIKLFSIQKELNNTHILQRDLSTDDKLKNRKIIESLFNSNKEKENVINAYKAFNINV